MVQLARTTRRGLALALVMLSGLAASVRAQDVQQAPLDRERLTRYARAYIAFDAARADFHAAIARIHDDIGLARARQDLDAKVAQIHVDHGFTSEEYGSITLLISQDERVKAVFESVVRDLRAAMGTP